MLILPVAPTIEPRLAITDADRQCDVFPTHEALTAAGFTDQADSDLLAINGPHKVGIIINNHAGAVKAMNGKSLKEQQAALRKPKT
mgnify:CR=1 FL=1